MADGDGEEEPQVSTAGRSRCRQLGSRICHGILGSVFFLMMIFSLVALVIFAAKHNEIDKHLQGDEDCVLYATKRDVEKQRLSSGVGCRFTIWGSALVAVGAGLFMLGYLFKTVFGSKVKKCWVCVELPLVLLLLVGSLAVSINTSLGLGMACMALKDAKSNNFFTASGSECKDYTVTPKNIKFFDSMVTSGIISWSITGALFLAAVLYIVLTVLYCRRSDDDATQPLLNNAGDQGGIKKGREKRENKNRPRKHGNDPDTNNPFLDK